MPRPKEFGLLSPEDSKWLASLRERYEEHYVMSNTDRTRLFRIKERARKVLDDLTYLAQILPEHEQEQLFTPAKVLPLIYNLTGRNVKEKVERHYQLARMFVEWSLPICQEKLDRATGSFLWSKFQEVEEIIRAIIPNKGYTAKTIDEKLVVEEKKEL